MGKRNWSQSEVRARQVSGHQIKRIVSPALFSLYDTIIPEKEEIYSTPVLTQRNLGGMLEVAAPETVLFMLCCNGVMSAAELKEFLVANRLDHLVVDNTANVAECILKKRDLGAFLDLMASAEVSLWKYNMECSWSDYLAVKSSALLRDYEIEYRMADGTTTWGFIEAIGITNIKKYGEELLCLEGVFTPIQIRNMIQRLEQPFLYPPRYRHTFSKRQRLHHIIVLARLIGAEPALRMRMPALVVALRQFTSTANTAEHFDFIEDYLFAAPDVDARGPNYRRIIDYYESGFTVDEAVQYTLAGIAPDRAAESRDNGVVVSVAEGWL